MTQGKVSVTEEKSKNAFDLTPQTRIAIGGSKYFRGSNRIQSSSMLDLILLPLYLSKNDSEDYVFTYVRIGANSSLLKRDADKLLQQNILPKIDKELVLQSIGIFEYIPISHLTQNHEKEDSDYMKRLIQENHLDAVLILHQHGNFNWSQYDIPEAKLWENISLYNPKQIPIAVVRIYMDAHIHGAERPNLPTNENDEVTIEPKTISAWDQQAYYRLFAKKTVGYLIKYFKEGPYQLKGMGWIPESERPPLIIKQKEASQ